VNTNLSAVEVVLDQRSHEWHQFRAKRIGASDAPIICGLSPWKSSLQLWMEKTGKIPQPDSSQNFAIQRGIRLEKPVRAMLSLKLDRSFEAITFSHPQLQYLMASLDGWDAEYRDGVEIKVGGEKDHKKLVGETESTPDRIIIPKKYYAQIQQQIHVAGVEYEYFASYYIPKGTDEMRGDLREVKVWRDEEFLNRYLPIAESFYHSLISNQPPEAVKLDI
jgi:putative phage-type endonuclease